MVSHIVTQQFLKRSLCEYRSPNSSEVCLPADKHVFARLNASPVLPSNEAPPAPLANSTSTLRVRSITVPRYTM